MDRLASVNGQFQSSASTFQSKEMTSIGEGKSIPEVVDFHPARGIKLDYFNKQGWGYADSGFETNKDKTAVSIKGNRYMYGGEILPEFLPWIMENIGADPKMTDPQQNDMEVDAPIINTEFINAIENHFDRRSFLKWERIMHSHGATFQEISDLRYGKFDRFCDMIVYPISTEQCEALVQAADKHGVMLVVYGGGTNVTHSLMIPKDEKRMVVSVDMARMNAVKWVDKENSMACVQAGIMGQDLERDLKQYGVCSGHEPDSQEFSTLGGWVSTRASGMKKNTYGNIEDIVQNVTYVTPIGTYSKAALWPRISNGPDLNHIVMGSEGNFGIVTDVVMKVKPLPQVRIFDSILFPDFEIGIQFMRAVSQLKQYPTSIRLVDNSQFQFGQTLKPAENNMLKTFIDKVKKFYVLNVKGFQPEKLVACTLLFEGDEVEMKAQHKRILAIGEKFQGMAAGADNGMRGYLLTFLIAYIRDFASEHCVAAESFETSCNWSMVSPLCSRVKKRILDEGAKLGYDTDKIWISFRVTQLYETGAAIYVYMTLKNMNGTGENRAKTVENYEIVEDAARDEVMLCGGCISHHHGVGKIRKQFIDRTLPPMAIKMQQELKKSLDPNNVFGINNTVYRTEEERQRIIRKF